MIALHELEYEPANAPYITQKTYNTGSDVAKPQRRNTANVDVAAAMQRQLVTSNRSTAVPIERHPTNPAKLNRIMVTVLWRLVAPRERAYNGM